MNKKISPTLIGAFVVGAVALIVIAVVILGSGRLFRHTQEFVLYFDSSVNGLRVGAPVKFRGVEIGSVKKILLQLDPDMKTQHIPVIIAIDVGKVTKRGGQGDFLDDPEAVKAAIDHGLRGQLQMESLLTGLLYVGLDVVPNASPNFIQPAENSPPYQEIPTVPTAFEKAQDAATRIIDKFEEIDFKKLIGSVEQAANGINATVNSPALRSALQSLEKTMPKVDEAIVSIRNVATTIDQNVKGLSGDLQQISAEARLALKQTGAAMREVEATVASMQSSIGPDSPTFYELTRSLREVSAAARSLRLLASYLERNPRAIIFGRPDSRED
jgi:paraquat-inducible protein B